MIMCQAERDEILEQIVKNQAAIIKILSVHKNKLEYLKNKCYLWEKKSC